MKKKEFEARKVLDDTEIYNDFISEKKNKVASGKISNNERNLHIIGMAKSSLNLIGGKLKNLELDYLRLIYASQQCKSSDKVIAYLLVWDEKIKKVIEDKWNKKYKVEEGKIFVFCFETENAEINKKVQEEKERNKKVITANSKILSEAAYSKKLLEDYLKFSIELRLKNINKYKKEEKLEKSLIDVSWDYYAAV